MTGRPNFLRQMQGIARRVLARLRSASPPMGSALRLAWVVAALWAVAGPGSAQVSNVTGFDLCGCAAVPVCPRDATGWLVPDINAGCSFGGFLASDSTTWPPGAALSGTVLQIPLPDDGVLVFDSFNWDTTTPDLRFLPNGANTPVTLLVKGDVNLGINGNSLLFLEGSAGGHGSTNAPGAGGAGGPGGSAGGHGASLQRQSRFGGDGLGPGGGQGSVVQSSTYNLPGRAFGGSHVANASLLPLIGGSGGGGGSSFSTAGAAGGGGGGGGALLVVTNGTLDLKGGIRASGGGNGNYSSFSHASTGAGGSGGAVRLVGRTLSGNGTVDVRGFFNVDSRTTRAGGNGRVRLERHEHTATYSMPGATVGFGTPGAVAPLFALPTIRITQVAGLAPARDANGFVIGRRGQGQIDIELQTPGLTAIGLETQDLPVGTTIQTTFKSRAGTGPDATDTRQRFTQDRVLASADCDALGTCTPTLEVALEAGKYTIETRGILPTTP